MSENLSCSSCKFFDYDEIYDSDNGEETQIFVCAKGHYEHIGFNTKPCEDFEGE